MRSRRLSTGAAALIMATTGLGVLVASQGAAVAATNCTGSLIENVPLKNNGGTTRGHIYVYYNSSTGYNCAKMVPNAGVSVSYMSLSFWKCAQTNPSVSSCDQVSGSATDAGPYSQYAGPISFYSPNNCINAHGYMNESGGSDYGSTVNTTGFEASHC